MPNRVHGTLLIPRLNKSTMHVPGPKLVLRPAERRPPDIQALKRKLENKTEFGDATSRSGPMVTVYGSKTRSGAVTGGAPVAPRRRSRKKGESSLKAPEMGQLAPDPAFFVQSTPQRMTRARSAPPALERAAVQASDPVQRTTFALDGGFADMDCEGQGPDLCAETDCEGHDPNPYREVRREVELLQEPLDQTGTLSQQEGQDEPMPQAAPEGDAQGVPETHAGLSSGTTQASSAAPKGDAQDAQQALVGSWLGGTQAAQRRHPRASSMSDIGTGSRLVPPNHGRKDVLATQVAAPIGSAVRETTDEQWSVFDHLNAWRREAASVEPGEARHEAKVFVPTLDDYTTELCTEIEDAYSHGIVKGIAPWYGADQEGTLFTDRTKVWNIRRLNDMLQQLDVQDSMPGVTTPYLYFGTLVLGVPRLFGTSRTWTYIRSTSYTLVRPSSGMRFYPRTAKHSKL